MVLGNDFHGIKIREDGYVGMCLDGFDEAGLYLGTRIVLMVEDAELRVPPLLVKVKLAILLLVEVYSPAYQLFYLGRSIFLLLFFGKCRNTRNNNSY